MSNHVAVLGGVKKWRTKCNTYCPSSFSISHSLRLSATSSICCAREEQTRQELRTRCERGRHFEFAPPDKLNDSPSSKLSVFAPSVRPRTRMARHQVRWRCYHVHVSFLPPSSLLGPTRYCSLFIIISAPSAAEAIQSVVRRICCRRRRHPRLG